MQTTLFAYIDGPLVLRRESDSTLRSLLALCGLGRSFNGPDFSIGAATSAALRGESGASRCASDAFRKNQDCMVKQVQKIQETVLSSTVGGSFRVDRFSGWGSAHLIPGDLVAE